MRATCIFVTARALLSAGTGTQMQRRSPNSRKVGGKAPHHRRGRSGNGNCDIAWRFRSPGSKNVTRRIRGPFLSVGAFVVLIAVLAMVDHRVRDRFTGLGPQRIWDQVTNERGQLAMAGANACEVIANHGRLAIFVVAGSVLVACMLRT